MVNINKDTYENNDIETIVDSIVKLCLNEKNIEENFTSHYKQLRSKI